MLSDFKYALRQMRKSLGFTMIAVLTLALGIGACTAVFSVVNTAILHPFSYPQLDRLVVVYENFLPKNPKANVSPGGYAEYQRQSTVFANLAAESFGSPNYTRAGDPIRAWTGLVTANFFSTLGVQPILGRDFRSEENLPGKGNVAILSHRLWLSDFGGSTDAIGQTLFVNGQRPVTIIGVMPADFQANLTDPRMYLPLNLPDQFRLNRKAHFLKVVGRLNDGVTIARAAKELDLVASRLAKQYPDTNKGWGVTLTSLTDDTVDFARPLLFTLLGAVGFLLLIACINIANLLLVRATSRQKEIAIRLALGASRRQIMRQLLCESLLLAACGGALGVFLAHASMKLMLTVSPNNLPRVGEISVNGYALVFSCALVLLTGFGFGVAPAFQATHVDLNEVLKDSGRGTSEGKRGLRLRGLLVVSEVAFALILLVGAGLLTRSFLRYADVDQGYQPTNLFAAPINLDQTRYPNAQRQINFVNQALGRVSGIRGVASATFTSGRLIPDANARHFGFMIAGKPAPQSNILPIAISTAIAPEYLKTLGIPLLRGRNFTAQDLPGTVPVMLINQELARLYFPGTDPIGQRINLVAGVNPSRVVVSPGPPPAPIWCEVVGVVGNTKSIDDPTLSQVYQPITQQPSNVLWLAVRATPGVPLDIRGICNAIHAVDKDVPITTLWGTTLNSGLPGLRRFSMYLSVVFSSIALLLAAIGIYGVMAFNVAQRTGEIGIRMALGAQRGDVLLMVLFNGGRMVAIGLLIGVAGALAAGRLIGSMLYNVSAYDPLTMIGVTIVFSLVGLLACWLPARRATKIDPMVALRTE